MADENTTQLMDAEQAPESNPTLCLLVCKSGQIIARPTKAVAQKVVMPLNLSGDTRLFMKAGEIVRPFMKVEFTHVQTLDVSGFTLGVYEETGAAEFDPAGIEEIGIRSLDKDFDELNPQPQPQP